MPVQAPAAATRSEFHCAHCGYGAVAKTAPDRCPMCGGTTWLSTRRPRTKRPTA